MGDSQGDSSEFEPDHHWSYSKSQSFRICPLKIYYKRTASGERFQKVDSSPQPVNLNAIIGLAVHRGIASEIEKWSDGTEPTFRGAKQEAEKWIQENWKFRDERITEVINGGCFSAEQRNRCIGISKRHLRRFFKAIWPGFRDHDYVLHEELQTFEVHGNPVHVRIDFCTRDPDGNLVITDWKTSRPSLLEFESFQLSVYGLWARKCMVSNINNIKIQLAHTRTGDKSTHSISFRQMEDVRDQIVRETKEWNDKNRIEDFTPDPDVKKCIACKFLSKCPDGRVSVE